MLCNSDGDILSLKIEKRCCNYEKNREIMFNCFKNDKILAITNISDKYDIEINFKRNK